MTNRHSNNVNLIGTVNAGHSIIAQKDFSCHPDDAHLKVVLAYRESPGGQQYVCWLYNGERDAFLRGKYFTYFINAQQENDGDEVDNYMKAMKFFNNRSILPQ